MISLNLVDIVICLIASLEIYSSKNSLDEFLITHYISQYHL